VGRLTPSMKWKPRIHNAPLTCEPGGSAGNVKRSLLLE
jgi:hypothetical protein